MSHECLKCNEVWKFEDYTCPCCGSCAVDCNSKNKPTLKYKFKRGTYDVIRLKTKESVFEEKDNYLNE